MLSNYPAGAEHDPNAPYNQSDQEPVEVEVDFSCVMRRVTTVETTRYEKEVWEDWEPNGEGGYDHTGGTEYYFDDNDFRDEYNEQRLTPALLIGRLKEELVRLQNEHPECEAIKGSWIRLIEECEGWEEEDDECGRA